MKSLIVIGILAGSTVGSFLPSLFGAGIFSVWAILGSLIGAGVGGYIGYYYTD